MGVHFEISFPVNILELPDHVEGVKANMKFEKSIISTQKIPQREPPYQQGVVILQRNSLTRRWEVADRFMKERLVLGICLARTPSMKSPPHKGGFKARSSCRQIPNISTNAHQEVVGKG